MNRELVKWACRANLIDQFIIPASTGVLDALSIPNTTKKIIKEANHKEVEHLFSQMRIAIELKIASIGDTKAMKLALETS